MKQSTGTGVNSQEKEDPWATATWSMIKTKNSEWKYQQQRSGRLPLRCIRRSQLINSLAMPHLSQTIYKDDKGDAGKFWNLSVSRWREK